MLKIPIKNITENDISMNKEFIILRVQEKSYKIPACELPYYHTEVFSVNNEKDKIRMVHYFLTNAFGGLKKVPKKNGIKRREIGSILKMVKAEHDPFPDYMLHLFSYGSLQSIQWHLLCHGIADYWINPGKPYLISGIIPEGEMKSVWSDFINQVQCERWGIKDLPAKNSGWRKKKWRETRNKLRERFGRDLQNVYGLHGCYNCINEQGAEKFIRCCNFFEKYRMQYLEKLRKWIIDTIKDNNLSYDYGKDRNALRDGKVSARRHIHATNKGTDELHAYVIDKEDGGKIHVYLMIFQLTKFNPVDISIYRLKTVYGIKSENSCAKAKTFITERVKHTSLTCNYFCHPSNWDAII